MDQVKDMVESECLYHFISWSLEILTLVGHPALVEVITHEGQVIMGTLKGYDQTTNVILKSAKERIFSDDGVEEVPLGLYIIRGDNVAVLGQVDLEADEAIDWANVKSQSLNHIRHH
ncbi:N-alpha-acetyltransferase 38, NatC auxiliary subunit-like protein [Gaertneriomyces semiglobifer]|nr:N-alpha-acetyltransferase 38, NatC auxiliary subunit-like protein [Gaertneriomyces semiglobifer]